MSGLPPTLAEFREPVIKYPTRLVKGTFGQLKEVTDYRDQEERWEIEGQQLREDDEKNKEHEEWRRDMAEPQNNKQKRKRKDTAKSITTQGRTGSDDGPDLRSESKSKSKSKSPGASKKQRKGGKRPRKTNKRRR